MGGAHPSGEHPVIVADAAMMTIVCGVDRGVPSRQWKEQSILSATWQDF
jgi:hypothetical protein